MKIEIGQKLGRFTVVGITTIEHGKYFPNRSISARILVEGPWNTLYEGVVRGDGWQVDTSVNYNRVKWIQWVKRGERVFDGKTGNFK